MPKIPDEIVRRIQDIARIEDVVGDIVGYAPAVRGGLRRAGVNLTCLCPFHDDQHDGNFIVRPSTVSEHNGGNTYRCFVCDAKGGPVQFLMNAEHVTFPDAIRWLGKRYSIPVDDVQVNWTPPPPRLAPPPLPQLTFKRDTVRRSMEGVESTLLVQWLYTLPWSKDQRVRLGKVLHDYCVAVCPHGPEWIAFWQITHDGRPLTAKYMRYKADGHRVKDTDEDGNKVFATDWEHAWRRREKQYDGNKYDTSGRALFGAHLLNRHPQAVVNIVESEKTALVMATFYGDQDKQLWMACGGLKFLKLEMLQPLIDQGRTIWLWPDKDGREAWQAVADKLGYEKCHVYTGFFETCWREEDGPKADCADITLRMMRTGDKPREVTDEGKGATEQKSTEALPHGATLAPVDDDTPFMDTEELIDPRVRQWREILRRKYNFNKTRYNDKGKNSTTDGRCSAGIVGHEAGMRRGQQCGMAGCASRVQLYIRSADGP